MITRPNPKDISDRLAPHAGTAQTVSTPFKQQESRKGKKPLLTQHDPAVIRQLKMLAARLDTTQQRLVGEALNMLFIKYGEQPIA